MKRTNIIIIWIILITLLTSSFVYGEPIESDTPISNPTISEDEITEDEKTNDNITFKLSLLTKNGKAFELRRQAKQKLYGYDILQGSCTDGKYGYYVLYHKKKEKCKIIKVRLSDLKVIKKSKSLALSHGNDLTYNSKTKKIVAVHATEKPKRLTIVNPSTLKIEKNINVSVPSSIKGFSGIAYDSTRNQYVLYTNKAHNFVILNSKFKLIKQIKPTKKNKTTYQGIDASKDYILVAQSPKPKTKQIWNIISVYDWTGKHLYDAKVSTKYEIESIYHIGNTYYAGFYKEYYNVKYKYKTKKVKVKWKKVNGKWKYKYKKKRVKTAYKKLNRGNYIYRIGAIE